MANRRYAGGPQRGNRGYPQNNMNPWQGGGNPQGPMPNNNIQAQLALALSNLLQPKPDMNNGPPSLLSLNPSQGGGYFNDNYGGPARFDRGRDMRRPEPYNKNRNTWRDNKGGNKNFGRPQRFNHRNDRKFDNKKESPKKDEKKDDNAEEQQDEKRDWKTEKNDDSTIEGNSEETGEKKDRSRFANLPAGLLHCFICNKSMWDGESFQNHIGGTAHSQMLNSISESFGIVVNILRENMRLAEEKEMIELNRKARSYRKFNNKVKEPQSVCNMCDMKFLGKITAHRKTVGHQRLKRFLHPKCDICSLEFPSRIEWVDHRFTTDHLFKLKEVLEKKTGGADGNIIVESESLILELEPLLDESLQSECENPVMELDEPLENIPNSIPAFKKGRAVATRTLKPASGFVCEICNRFFESEAIAQDHLKTMAHYTAFVTAIKKKARRAAAEEEAKLNLKKDSDDNGDNTEEKAENMETNEDDDADHLYDPEMPDEEGDEAEDSEIKDETDEQMHEEEEVEEKEPTPPPTPRRNVAVRGRRASLRK